MTGKNTFRRPRSQRIMLAITYLFLIVLTGSVFLLTIGLLAAGDDPGVDLAVALVFSALLVLLAPICWFVTRELRALWGWKLVIEGERIHLHLPAQRTTGHNLPTFRATLNARDIEALITRTEHYVAFGVLSTCSVTALKLTSGEIVVLGEDRVKAVGSASVLIQGVTAKLRDTFSIPVEKHPSVKGSTGFGAMFGNQAPAWDSAVINQEQIDSINTSTQRSSTALNIVFLVLFAAMIVHTAT